MMMMRNNNKKRYRPKASIGKPGHPPLSGESERAEENIAFFAATPLQAFNCLNIRMNHYPNDRADLYLLSFAADLSPLFSACRESEAFQNVYYLHGPHHQRGRIRFLYTFLFPNKQLVRRLRSARYDRMFSTRIGAANDFYYTYIKKENPAVQFHYYEEGVGDYYFPIERHAYRLVKLIGRLGYENPFQHVKALWLYHPAYRAENLQYPTRQIATVQRDSEFARKACNVFGLRLPWNLPEDCRLIYLDQAYKKQLDIDVDHISVLDIIARMIPKKNIYVKIHPTNNINQYSAAGYQVLAGMDVPWEVLQCAADFSGVILVSVNSTAVISPKAMLDDEPSVMLLYRYLNERRFINMDLQDQYFQHIRQSYRDTGCFHIPADEAALIQALHAFTIKNIDKNEA